MGDNERTNLSLYKTWENTQVFFKRKYALLEDVSYLTSVGTNEG